MLKVDFHTHTLASGHAMNSLEEMLLQADRIGLEGIAITEKKEKKSGKNS